MSTITIDIETLPADWDDATKSAAARDAVPANYSKPDTIEKWVAENADAVHRRTALDPMAGRILCIGYAVGDGAARVAYDASGANTLALLDELHAAFIGLRSPVWIGHNLAGFDLPWLKRHAWRLGHPVSRLIPFTRFSPMVADTMLLWQGGDTRGHTKLSAIAEFLGVGSKAPGLDGSKVYDAWLEGQHDRIASYCAQDVELTRAIYRRIS